MAIKAADLDCFPPVVQLLLREWSALSDPPDCHKFFKRLFPELRRQAEWTVAHTTEIYTRRGTTEDGLCVSPSSGLDPFSIHGKCFDLQCRIANADYIARTVGLYADSALIGDPFTDIVLSDRWTRTDTLRLLGNQVALLQLLPLFQAGVFQFVSNFGAFCKEHSRQFRLQVKRVTKEVLSETVAAVSIERSGDTLILKTDEALGPPVVYSIPLKSRAKRAPQRSPNLRTLGLSFYENRIQHEVHETLFQMRRAGPSAVTFSNSRVAVLAARQIDGHSPPARDIEVWEMSRSAALPWVSNLSAAQVLALRDSARNALPRFRACMARSLTSPSVANASQLTHDLREEAAEVEAELRAIDSPSEARFRTLSGLLGMTISIYGFAGEFLTPAAALTGLASILGLLHAADHKEREQIARVTSKPGYVLVKARELTEHARRD